MAFEPTQGLPQVMGKKRSFWSRVESLPAWAVQLGIGIGAFFGLKAMLPTLTSFFADLSGMFSQAIAATLYGTVFFTLFYLIFIDKRVRTLYMTALRAVSRRLTNFFIPVFYIDILKDKKKRMSEALTEAVTKRRELKASMGSLFETVKGYAVQLKEEIAMVTEAKRRNMATQVTLHARAAGRLGDDIRQFQNLYQVMSNADGILAKMEGVSRFWTEAVTSQSGMTLRKKELLDKAYGSLRAALGVIDPESDEDALYAETMEALARDYDDKMGEITTALDSYGHFIGSIDLRQGAFAQTALDQLESFGKKADQILGASASAALLPEHTETADIFKIDIPEFEPVPVERRLPEHRGDDSFAARLLEDGDDDTKQ